MTSTKTHLHDELREVRAAVLAKLDGLGDHDLRRPMTGTGTNLLGLVKHLATWEARYLGEVFARPFPEPLPSPGADMWATEHETRAEITDLYRRVWAHADATITALALDAPGHVPWWPSPDVTLFKVLIHLLTETSRHAGHADILREHLDGAVGAETAPPSASDVAKREARRAEIERIAEVFSPSAAGSAASGIPRP
ncbi:putative damage-inducible protein DinB [Actinokineospora baliensis]|uniref:DinB family protein n=1 Tax=Actinokineospora baliensis TaxID=547056 RepID=UPI0019599360|nr:DinB family protein [Actinokineospora baliensis]MBM7776245.1 putative damage-inducible protein DinB [Actinokineospora baliensis]